MEKNTFSQINISIQKILFRDILFQIFLNIDANVWAYI